MRPSPPSPQAGWNAPQASPHAGWSAPNAAAPAVSPGGAGGWTAPAHSTNPAAAPPQTGWNAPPAGPHAGWSAPQATAPGPAGAGWSAPNAAANTRAQWQESGGPRSAFDWFFKPPPDLPEAKHGLYKLLTLAAGPLVAVCFLTFFMFKARYRRHGVTGVLGAYAHILGSGIYASVFYWIGAAFGFNGWWLAAPVLVLGWVPMAARYALWKLG